MISKSISNSQSCNFLIHGQGFRCLQLLYCGHSNLGEEQTLQRLKLALKCKQKAFVAHPNVQQLLASIWYEGLPGFRQMNMILQFLEVCRIGLLFPLFSLAYIICPWASFSQKLRKPFIKFICTSASYFTFLCK